MMSHRHAFLSLVILFCVEQERSATETGQFLGGSLSFTIINGTNGSEIQLDVTSGWVLGLGPCGIHCSSGSMNSDTRLTSEVFLKENDNRYFGNWTVVYATKGETSFHDINPIVYDGTKENVIAVNEKAHWEQDRMVVRFPAIKNASSIRIYFEGKAWRNLSMQGGNIGYHLQVMAVLDVRNDTGKPNHSPQAYCKPYYRLPLGQDSYIRIPTSDPDGDYVRCSMATYVEAEGLTNYPLRNVTVTKDCIILIQSHKSLGYANGSWGAIPVMVRDYNKEIITYGRSVVGPYYLSLSTTTVQFAVQVLDEVNEPRFLPPTPVGNHRFSIYYGSAWKVEIYAEPNSAALIDHFSCMGLQRENVKIINVKDTLYLNHQNVKMATLSWTPLDTDIGEHIICVDVVDTNGMDSSDQRCFMIEVRKFPNTSQPLQIPMDMPYFLNIAGKDALWCDVNYTCTIPIYGKTPFFGAQIKSIRIISSFLDWTEMDKEIQSNITTGVGQSDLRVRHTSAGSPQVCLQVMDSTGRVGDTCITIRIIPPDPCLLMPCIHGDCIRSADDLSKFHCQCATDHYYGQFCEMEKPDCVPNPCQHGRCRDKPGPSFFCLCEIGWKGRLCDTVSSGHTSIGSSSNVQQTTVKSGLWGANSPPPIVG